jgi:glutamate-5-semialdehyde dehydrogenase
MKEILSNVRDAARKLALLSPGSRNTFLECFAEKINLNRELLLNANQLDLKKNGANLSSVLLSRLKLDDVKLNQIIDGIRDVVKLPDPIGKLLAKTELDTGLILDKVSVPIGVLAIIFESRPDVIPQILSLALKSGNGVVLKGGSEATETNQAFIKIVREVENKLSDFPSGWATLIEGRESVFEVLNYPEYIDLVIPRGSNALVKSIMEKSQIPVMGHSDGICHVYVHRSAEPKEALRIILDSKAQYPAVCNATETVLIDQVIAKTFLPELVILANENKIELLGCKNCQMFDPKISAVENWSTEYGDLRMAIKIVEGPKEAVEHINLYSSHHTDVILANDQEIIESFLQQVDSASVFANCSSRFSDGYRYGFGAEVGVSTGKLHARGPVGLEGLLTYKYIMRGSGQVVKDYVGKEAKKFTHRIFS